ncbi:hypothetical protein LCM20_12120 [Halobacillus litoralis]|uniref:hypothetical protein n=1 Tax=Halobacillus litoralis TaxID=45668 RepID=UPI001CD65AA6|nr:hypothetical protein [Halobacillus litoralis]MCA0971344.1 hypothetical protein [Halobacillus litoralis]
MIRPESIPHWPKGVQLREKDITDHSLKAKHEITEISGELLRHVDGKRSIQTIVSECATKHGWPEEHVLSDFLELISNLNHHYLINIQTPFHWTTFFKDRLIALFVLLRTLQGPKWETKERKTASHQSQWASLWQMIRVVTMVYGAYAIGIAFVTGILSFLLPVGGLHIPLLTAGSFLTGMIVHEYLHVWTFQKMTSRQFEVIIAIRRKAVQIVRPRADRKTEFWTSLSGPGIPVLTAFILIPLLFIVPAGELQFAIGCMAATQIVHLLSLMPFAEDGKRIIESIKPTPLPIERKKSV